MMVKTICVTGGTGFVGQGVVPILLERGYHVRALARSESSARKLSPHPNLEIVIGDATNANDVYKALLGCDALLHLVGIRMKEVRARGLTYEDVDVRSVEIAIEAMHRAGVKRMTLLSGAFVGKSFYVLSKLKAEGHLRRSDLDWSIVRPAMILGPGQEWARLFTPLLKLMAIMPGKVGEVGRRIGNVTREELARAFIWTLENQAAIHQSLEVPDILRVTSEL